MEGRGLTGEKFKKGYWYEPTIIVNVNHDMLIMQEETFGPAKPVMPFETIDQVIEWANSTRYGVAAYVYTNNLNTARIMARRLEAGNIGINNVGVATIEAPYPGWKESGLGCDLGREGLKYYLEVKQSRCSTDEPRKPDINIVAFIILYSSEVAEGFGSKYIEG